MSFLISTFLLTFMTLVLVLTSLWLLVGQSVSFIFLFVAFVATTVLFVKMFGKKRTLYALLCSAAIIVVCLLIAGLNFENTWDGCAYQKQAVGLLKEGWNPGAETATEFNERTHSIDDGDEGPLKWTEVYPKGTWYWASSIYQLTGNIEYGKSYTLIFAAIFGCHLYSYLRRRKIALYFSLPIGILGGLNPIVFTQFQTYYLDSVVGCVVLGLLLCFLEWYESPPTRIRQVQIVSYIIWCCNLKFSVVLYAITYCAVFLIFLLWRRWYFPLKEGIFLGVSGVLSVFLIGWAPYMTNIIRYHNPLYGFTGMFSQETFDVEFGISHLGNVGRFFVALLGRTSHGNYHSLSEVLKIPFTYRQEELIYYSIPDARVGGFGIFFSGLLLVSVLYLVLRLVRLRKEPEPNDVTLFVAFTFVVSVVEMANLAGTHTARYIPQMYGIVLYMLCGLARHSFTRRGLRANLLPAFCGLLLFLSLGNDLPWIPVSVNRIRNGQDTRSTFLEMEKQSAAGVVYDVSFYSTGFNGIQYNLKDFHIAFDYTPRPLEELSDYSVTYSNWLFYKELSR